MRLPRASGILLHPTSLPGRGGIGDLGAGAEQFVDFLASARQRCWQVLPLGPTGYGDSPYQNFSAFAGNPLLVSLERLVAEGLLEADDLASLPPLPDDRVDFGPVIEAKWHRLRRSYERFRWAATGHQRAEFAAFREAQRDWLDDYALFMALKEAHGGAAWVAWPADIRRRVPAALARWRGQVATATELHAYVQWQVFRQWTALRAYAAVRDVRIIGDLPIFVAYDSADVWANPDLFFLNEQGVPTVVAGVPPDYFSATGQLWGNPLYRWEALAATGYDWWIRRIRAVLAWVDLVRIDHFRGFEAYWAVAAGETTAVNGRWTPGPGLAFFNAVRAALGDLPLIAEDLGLITPPVEALRDAAGLPGMAVLQFGFGDDAANPHLPHTLRSHEVVYTGTHDNDTTAGWFATLDTASQRRVRHYLGDGEPAIGWAMIRAALASVADLAIVPLQDVLGLGAEGRMNRPGQPSGNWSWRYQPPALRAEHAARLADLTTLYGRDGVVDRARAARAAAEGSGTRDQGSEAA